MLTSHHYPLFNLNNQHDDAMSYVLRAQERLTHDNKSYEHLLGMQLSNEGKRRIRETNFAREKGWWLIGVSTNYHDMLA